MAFELQGTLHTIFETQSFGASGFTKREFVVMIEEDSKYPQPVRLALVKDKCDAINDYSEGDKVKVQFDLRGNEHNGRFYTDLQAWRLESADGGGGGGNNAPQQQQQQAPASEQSSGGTSRPVTDDADEYF